MPYAEEKPEAIAVGASVGALAPLAIARYRPTEAQVSRPEKWTDYLKDPAIASSLAIGAGGLGLAIAGKKGTGPLWDNPDMINVSAALGGASLITGLGMAMYPLRSRAEAAGHTLASPGVKSAGTSAKTPERFTEEAVKEEELPQIKEIGVKGAAYY